MGLLCEARTPAAASLVPRGLLDLPTLRGYSYFSLDNFWKIKRKLYKNEPQNRVSVISNDEIKIFGIVVIKTSMRRNLKDVWKNER